MKFSKILCVMHVKAIPMNFKVGDGRPNVTYQIGNSSPSGITDYVSCVQYCFDNYSDTLQGVYAAYRYTSNNVGCFCFKKTSNLENTALNNSGLDYYTYVICQLYIRATA